jgi:hypothetical protein
LAIAIEEVPVSLFFVSFFSLTKPFVNCMDSQKQTKNASRRNNFQTKYLGINFESRYIRKRQLGNALKPTVSDLLGKLLNRISQIVDR